MSLNVESKVVYRDFDFHTKSLNVLRELYELTYNSKVNEDVWFWKYLKHPENSEIRIIVATINDKIVGATTRMPVDLMLDNNKYRVYFNVDSMVHPDYRRRGIMQNLYRHTASSMPVQYSKGTNPDMYILLKKIGYRDMLPNTFLVKYLSVTKLLLSKIKICNPRTALKTDVLSEYNIGGEFTPVGRFGQEFDDFWCRVSPGYKGIIIKNSNYMNWRYKDISNRDYHVFYRKKVNRIISVVVMRIKKVSGSIVDMLWDTNEIDEPFSSIRFCMDFFRGSGVLKITYWGTLDELRTSFKKNGFIETNETPHFSVFSIDDTASFEIAERIHFVEGDSDSEYLS